LLDQIQAGKKLRSVKEAPRPELERPETSSMSLAAMLNAKLRNREEAMGGNDGSDTDSDDDWSE
jgi:hypothetical protein